MSSVGILVGNIGGCNWINNYRLMSYLPRTAVVASAVPTLWGGDYYGVDDGSPQATEWNIAVD